METLLYGSVLLLFACGWVKVSDWLIPAVFRPTPQPRAPRVALRTVPRAPARPRRYLASRVLAPSLPLSRAADGRGGGGDGLTPHYVMQTIHKYRLSAGSDTAVMMPEGADVLTVQMQHGRPCLWAVVDLEAPLERRHFLTYGTGHPLSEGLGGDLTYVGTYQMEDGALVFHVFELR